MTRPALLSTAAAGLFLGLLPTSYCDVDDSEKERAKAFVVEAIQPLMDRDAIPGMAVGVVANGQSYVFTCGVASKATGKPVTGDTLFEIGSVTKTFTATLACYAQVEGRLSLADSASKYLPELRGSHFDDVSLLNLGTHTSGGLPLQVPESVTNDEQLIRYFQGWKPTYAPGTYRKYGNPGIGLLGRIAETCLHKSYSALMEGGLFPALGLKHTFLDIPPARMGDYAEGYTTDDAPTQMKSGVLAAETYGVRTTAGDLLRYVEANMGLLPLDSQWQRAITATHTGYYRIGPMTQDLIWEQYPYPVALTDLLAGNSDKVILEANPATPLNPPLSPPEDVLINKTGSTNGFSTYVAFIPEKKLGVVLLANKRYPIAERVTTANAILSGLEKLDLH
jgi:beta-lactamase class C